MAAPCPPRAQELKFLSTAPSRTPLDAGDVDERAREVILVIHWHGGQHFELRLGKPQS
jgi:hypothetical protein